jgi:hypothetical protein
VTISHFFYVFYVEEEEEELLFLAVEEASWLYASLGCIISAAVLFSGRPIFIF